MAFTKREICECPPRDSGLDLRPVDGPEADRELGSFAKALAHPARAQIIRLLARKNACICGEIVDQVDLAPTTVSQHLKVLKDAGVIRGEIDGPRVSYCLDPQALRRIKALVAML